MKGAQNNIIYFDNAASSFPKPMCVAEAVNSAVIKYGANPGRSGHKLAMAAEKIVYETREEIASLLNAEAQNIVFTLNGTHALNTAIQGTIEKGDHVLISCLEHNSVYRPLVKLQEKDVSFDIFEVDFNDDNMTLENIKNKINSKTKAVIASHSSNITGKILPVKLIGEFCKANNLLFIIDACQSAGNIPIDLKKIKCDVLCSSGHKSLYGPQGTGIMVINSDVVIDTLMQGGSGARSVDNDMPKLPPERYEAGTVNTPGIAGLCSGVRYIKKIGIEKIHRYEQSLCADLYNKLARMNNIILYTPCPDLSYANVLSFNVKGKRAAQVGKILDKHNICVRTGICCAPLANEYIGTSDGGVVRCGFGIYNNKKQIDYFCSIIDNIK